jgi:hypothetical protein
MPSICFQACSVRISTTPPDNSLLKIGPSGSSGSTPSISFEIHPSKKSVIYSNVINSEDLILLQLVQALRYESEVDSSLEKFLLEIVVSNFEICSNFYWYINVECANETKTNIYKNIFEKF